MSGLINKVKDAMHKDKDSDNNTTGTTGTGYGSSNTGYNTAGHAGSTNAGPHSSNAANSADPRVDSDLDRSRNAGLNQTTNTSGGYGSSTGGIGSTGGVGSSGYSGSTNAGPHSSNIANSADPRVDSDLDRSRNAGLNQTTGGYGSSNTHGSSGLGSTGDGYGSSNTHGSSGLGSTGAGYGSSNTGSSTAGPHSSNIANKLDPRVDSDLDASRNAGMNQHTRADTAGGYGSSTTHGNSGLGSTGAGYGSSTTHGSSGIGSNTHGSSGLGSTGDGYGSSTTHGNSGLGNTGTTGGYGSSNTSGNTASEYASPGSGSSTNAGPHNSNILNKLDPRVDSNLDGSKTTGGDKTYQ